MTLRNGRARESAFSMVEAALSVVLVGVVLVAALNVLGGTKMGQRHTTERLRGHLLAEELISEILRKPYADPQDIGPIDLGLPTLPVYTLGPDLGESTNVRNDLDDVDDYNNWQEAPPENRDGSDIAGLDSAWKRKTRVRWVDSRDLTTTSLIETGLKEIKATVTFNDATVAELTALKSAGLPDAGDTPPRVLYVSNGMTMPLPIGGEPLLVPDVNDTAKIALMEAWGFVVMTIHAASSQGAFNTAVAGSDIVYVASQTNPSILGSKVANVSIGVVDEVPELVDTFGLCQETLIFKDADEIRVDDNTHYITLPLPLGIVKIGTVVQKLDGEVGSLAPNLRTLAQIHNVGVLFAPSLILLESGAGAYPSGTAAGRRVKLPWGKSNFNPLLLTSDGLTIMKRAIEWAAGKEQSS